MPFGQGGITRQWGCDQEDPGSDQGIGGVIRIGDGVISETYGGELESPGG